ncbi:hypothetical protein GS475_02705 [Rhodococcus hoagii]|nr:hypothetical protein [Prescottella equi]
MVSPTRSADTVTPEAIEHIEDGVKRAHDAIDALGDIGDNLANLVTKEEANATYARRVRLPESAARSSTTSLRAGSSSMRWRRSTPDR